MIDFLISNRETVFDNGIKQNIGKSKLYAYKRDEYSFQCYAYLPEIEFHFEDEEFFILVYGIVFANKDYHRPFVRLFPEEILKHIKELLIDPSWLRGIFTLIVYQKKSKKLTIISDLIGLSPIYYTQVKDRIYISSNLFALSHLHSINGEVLLEKIIFEHSLTNDTLLKSTKRLEQATILETINGKINYRNYFDWKEFLLNAGERKFNRNEFLELFNSIIKARANLEKTNLLTLTGGHDGRAVLSGFIKNKYPVRTFSFGGTGYKDLTIPDLLAAKMGFEHISIRLSGDFYRDYVKNGINAILLSDSELPFEQQSTIYASNLLDANHDFVYSGLIAGEVLGPMRHIRNYLNYRLFQSTHNNYSFDIGKFLQEAGLSQFLTQAIPNAIDDKLKEIRSELMMFDRENLTHLKILYHLITYGFKYFYGSQIHLQRYNLINIPVFYDFDLISVLIRTNFHLRFKNNLKGLFSRSNSREIQLYIINKNSSRLGSFPVDLGYQPKLYKTKISTTLIPLYYYYNKYRNNIAFNGQKSLVKKWAQNYCKLNIDRKLTYNQFIDKKAVRNYLLNLKRSDLNYDYQKNRLVSLFTYTQEIAKKCP